MRNLSISVELRHPENLSNKYRKLNQSIIIVSRDVVVCGRKIYVKKAICWHSRETVFFRFVVLTGCDCCCHYCCGCWLLQRTKFMHNSMLNGLAGERESAHIVPMFSRRLFIRLLNAVAGGIHKFESQWNDVFRIFLSSTFLGHFDVYHTAPAATVT